MKHNTKRDLILDAMEYLLIENSAQSISVSDIAKKAGIGKGSIYYYFQSKNDILEAMMERSYSIVIEKCKEQLEVKTMDAFKKMAVIFQTCRESSLELKKQENNNFFEIQQSALLHQKYISIMVKNLKPILAENIRQGIKEGSIICDFPDETAEIVLIILTIKLDNHFSLINSSDIQKTLDTLTFMLETSMHIEKGKLNFLQYEK